MGKVNINTLYVSNTERGSIYNILVVNKISDNIYIGPGGYINKMSKVLIHLLLQMIDIHLFRIYDIEAYNFLDYFKFLFSTVRIANKIM